MSKDKVIGGLILALCVVLLVGYYVAMIWPDKVPFVDGNDDHVRVVVMAVILGIAWTVVMVIGGWIGYTMLTLPPAVPVTLPEEEEEEEQVSTEEAESSEQTQQQQ